MVCFYCKCPGHNRNKCPFRRMLLELIPDLQGAIQDKLHIVKKEWDIKICRNRLDFQLKSPHMIWYPTRASLDTVIVGFAQNYGVRFEEGRKIKWIADKDSECNYMGDCRAVKRLVKPDKPHKNMKMGKVYWNPKHRDHFGR